MWTIFSKDEYGNLKKIETYDSYEQLVSNCKNMDKNNIVREYRVCGLKSRCFDYPVSDLIKEKL